MNNNQEKASFELLAKLGKATSPREAGELLEKESALVDELFLSFFTDLVTQQITATLIYPESKFQTISKLASERYNINLILELFRLQNVEWTFFFKEHHRFFQFPFTLKYLDILLEGETGEMEEYILQVKKSLVRFAAARDLLYEPEPHVTESRIRESYSLLNTAEAKNYLADCVNDNSESREKALFCLQTIADHTFNAALDTISTMQLRTALKVASSHPEPEDKAKAMKQCLMQMNGESDSLKALLHFHIAHAYVESRTGEPSANIEDALYHFEEAGKFYTKESDPLAWARVQNGFARCYSVYQKNGAGANIERSITYLRLADDIFSPIDNPYDWAYTQNNLGAAYLERIEDDMAKNVRKAIAFFESALSVQSMLYCPEAWALSMTNLGEAYHNRFVENRIEQGPKAISIFEKVTELYTEQSSPYEWALLQRRIGNVYVTLGTLDPFTNIEMAMSHFIKAKANLTPERYPNDWAVLMRQMGDAFAARIQGDPMVNQESAIECYTSAFAIVTIKTQPYSWATLHHALALIYRVRLRGARSENMALSARHIAEAKLVLMKEQYPTDWASLEHLLGIIALEHRKPNIAEDFEDAINHFSEALTIRNPVSSFHLWIETVNSLAGAYTDSHNVDSSSNQQKGIDLYEEVLEKLSPHSNLQSWCIITADLGRALVKANFGNKSDQQKRARELFDEVLKVQTPVNHPRECFKVAFMLGKLHFGNGNFDEALRAFQKSFESSENLRAQSGHEFLRRQLASDTSEMFQIMITCCLKLKNIEQAFYYASAGKARTFADLLQLRNTAPQADLKTFPPQARELQTKIDVLREAIDQITTSSTYVLTGGYFQKSDGTSLLAIVSDKRHELLKHLEEMAFRYPDLSDSRHAPAVSAMQLKKLSADRPAECFVEYYRDKTEWGAFILSAGELNHVILPNVSDRLLNDTFLYIAECEKLALAKKAVGMPDSVLQRHLTGIYNAFVLPLSLTVSLGSRIVLSLTRELSLIPVNIAFDSAAGKYFCEEYALSFIPGLNALYWLLRSIPNNQTTNTGKQRLLSVVHAGHTRASRLLFAQKESDVVAAHFAASPSSVILREDDALIADILKHTNSGIFDAIHFVCHGQFNTSDPIHSGLILGDGVLTAERVQASVELKNKPLVLLSACQTGQVAIAAGDETIGLIQSFFAAGAGSVVASQWSINDASSMEIFRRYFDLNRSTSKAEALRQAMLAVKKMPGWSHPLYWAAFTITGVAD